MPSPSQDGESSRRPTAAPWRDARSLQEALKALLGAWDHTVLPDELASGEALASAIMNLLQSCVGVDIARPAERIFCQVRA